MKELLIYVVKNLVDFPDQISVNEVEKDDSICLELSVSPDDMGKVIGRQGRIAKEIRTLMKAYGLKDNKKITVDIID